MKSFVDRDECPMRHENGNCTVTGGFCTAVNDPICEALHNAFYCGERSKLDEYKKAEAEGRLVILPCKVGDTVYRFQRYFNDATLKSEIKIKPCVVGSFSSESIITTDHVWILFSNFGKTVFLTREEAEKALED